MPLILCLLIGALLPALPQLKPAMALAGALFLFVSALELDLRDFRGEFPLILRLGCGAFFPPLLLGLALGLGLPGLFPSPGGGSPFRTALVLAIAMSVSAVPVILKILQEIGALGTAVGRRVVLTAIFCDLAAWLCFFPLLPLSKQASWGFSHLTLVSFLLGLGVVYRSPGILARQPWLGKLNHWVAAPLFFVGVGQSLDFTKTPNLAQIGIVFAVASVSKIAGVLAASRGQGIGRADRRLMALALNARGAMEILMATLARQAGLLDHDLFVSLVVMAVGTSLLVKPVLRLGIAASGPESELAWSSAS